MKPIRHVSVDEQITRNRHKTWLVISIFVLIVLFFSITCSCLYDLVAKPSAQIDVISVSIIMMILTLIYVLIMIPSSRAVLMFLNHATPLTERQQAPILYDVVEEMAIAFGLPFNRISICIANDSAPNAFSIGNLKQTTNGWTGYAAVGVTAGLNMLNREELECVIGHEMGHLRDEDTRLESIGASLMALFSVISRICLYLSWGASDNNDNNSNSDNNNSGGAVLLLALAFLGWVCSGLCYLTQMCLSRTREYLADDMSVKMTQDPTGMINALNKVSQAPRIKTGNPTCNSLYFESILPKSKHKWSIHNLFDTHPSTLKRIYRIEQMN